jgi:16S rRNA (uracil1498-N3)-methyltransferase
VWTLAVNANAVTGAKTMPLRRLYVAEKLAPGAELRLGGEAARYLGRVLRLRAGDSVNLFNGDDGEWSATISAFGKERLPCTKPSRMRPSHR